jgi:hypothetical protein
MFQPGSKPALQSAASAVAAIAGAVAGLFREEPVRSIFADIYAEMGISGTPYLIQKAADRPPFHFLPVPF